MTQGTAAAWGHAWGTLDALVDADGTAGHGHARALRRPRADRQALGDAVHALLQLHGGRPGLAGEAALHAAGGVTADWLDALADGMAAERQALSRLAAAVGPLPSTPGQAATDAAYVAQRHAFGMLARSDRAGVAAGAAGALALDWPAIRRVLACAADAYGTTLPPSSLPTPDETATVLGLAAERPAAERALLFGARALVDQHRALWSLLEARAAARAG